MPYYNIYNYLVQSELEMPCAIPVDNVESTKVDFSILFSKNLTDQLPEVSLIGKKHGSVLRTYDVGVGILFCVLDKIKILVNYNDNTINIETDKENIDVLKAFLTGMGLSIFMLDRGLITLHSAGVYFNDKLIGIMADSGVGKSTLLWTLMNHGALFVTDDVLPISFINDSPFGLPSISLPSRLWKDRVEELECTPNYRPIAKGWDKCYVPIEDKNRILNTVRSQP